MPDSFKRPDRMPASIFKRLAQTAAVLAIAMALAFTAFYVIDLAFDLFHPAVGYTVNLAIIAVFSFISWKLRYFLYDNLHFLH